MHFIKVEMARAPLSGCNPSGSEDPGHPCNARWLSSQTFQKHLSSGGKMKKVKIGTIVKTFLSFKDNELPNHEAFTGGALL